MLKYQKFVEQYSEKYGGFAKKIADFMENREISSLMGDDLYECFGTKTAIGKTQFYLRRSALIDFVEFSDCSNKKILINHISNLTQVQLAKHIDENSSAYKSLDELLELLNQMVLEKGLHSADATPLQSMAILIWLNYSNEDIVDFKISDINGLKNLDNKYKKILRTYAGLKYCRALPSGRVQNFLKSEYLFRTANTNQLTVLDVKKTISRYNKFLSEKNRSFTRAVLVRSATFVEIYQKYNLNITPEIIRERFGKSLKPAEVNKLTIEYNKWAEQLQN